MTIRYQYKCDACEHNYVEQRGNDEPNPYFSTCHSCGAGSYEEVSKEVLAPEPERVPAPEVILEETPAE